MVSRENDDSQELTAFKQPSKKQTRFKHPSKEEEILALLKGFVPANTCTRKNTTRAYKVCSDWVAKKEQQCQRTVSRKFVLTTCISTVWLLPAYCLLLLFTCIFLILVVECFFTNRSLSAFLTNCVSSVANQVLNASCPIECCCCQSLINQAHRTASCLP